MSCFFYAGIAQLGRAAGLYSVAPDKRHVGGSIPSAGTIHIGERQSWRAGADCKSVALQAEWVRIPPPLPLWVDNFASHERVVAASVRPKAGMGLSPVTQTRRGAEAVITALP